MFKPSHFNHPGLSSLSLASALPLVLGLASYLGAPAVASACGGTFCDAGPNAMPVEQSGENILFVFDEGFVEAHIEIQYDPNTNAQNFAWVIPVLALPEVSVGSDLLFAELLQFSVPTYGFNTQSSCQLPQNDGAGSGAFDGGGDEGVGDGDGDGDGVEVVLEEKVGAFDVVVLQSTSVPELMTWLGTNGYQQDPNAEPIFQEYLDEGFLFVAIKLSRNAEMNEIHPIVVRYEGDEPCVPIRLTRIAAVPEMEIRTFFLGDARTVPSTYRHVEVNPLMIDWPNFGANYGEVISLAVDSEGAEGRAFVTEFAGAHQLVTENFYSPSWMQHGLAQVTDPTLAMPGLMTSGLMQCFDDVNDAECVPAHPLMTGLLTKYLPPPAGVEAPIFWGCLECYADQIDVAAWDGPAFAADITTRIVVPGQHARDLVEQFPYLTRLYTLISPWEMTADPMFYENPDLPEVPSLRLATQTVDCDGDSVWTLPDGRSVNVPLGVSWPEFPEAMPYEERVEQGLAAGPNQVLFSRTQLIDDLLADWNAANPVLDEAGCACSTTDGGGLAGAAFFAVAFGGLLRRRRRA